jgi:NAD(P)-dependent dehydrogenase (short-subunit alcohol dehydrogenase family)
MDPKGQAALVTGAASGLGAATAKLLAQRGAKVTLLDVNDAGAVAAEIGGLALKCDVTNEGSASAAIDQARTQHGTARILVNCAGVGPAKRIVGRDGPMPLADFKRVIDINLIGTFNLMRIGAAAIARTEAADADGQRGVVINTASVAGIEGQTGQVAYSASKGGIIGMTVPAARDLAAIGVRVNTICPGIIDTPIYGAGPGSDEFKARLIAPIVFPKRMGTAAEFAQLVRSLVENDYMNADVIRFDGGIRFQPK